MGTFENVEEAENVVLAGTKPAYPLRGSERSEAKRERSGSDAGGEEVETFGILFVWRKLWE